jgi:hypothetical protein
MASDAAWPPCLFSSRPWYSLGHKDATAGSKWVCRDHSIAREYIFETIAMNDELVTHAASNADESISERPSLPEAVPHTTQSLFVRMYAWFCKIRKNIAMTTRWPRLSDHLPSVPDRSIHEIIGVSAGIPTAEERAEAMLLDIMRASPEYVDAATLIARATTALRKQGDDVFAEGFVVFALSRMPTNDDGTVTIERLREQVGQMPVARSLMTVLFRLEEQGVIAMDLAPESTSRIVSVDQARVRLLVVP